MILLLLVSSVSFAENNKEFSDLENDHWAYSAIMTMSQKGIINGYGDGTFKPNNSVSRAEFAKMLVKSLDISINEKAKSSFIDMEDGFWVVPYVEASKQFLTGYSTSNGIKFKPNEAAVREDMAVAIVKAKEHKVDKSYEKYLNEYSDKNLVSDELTEYVGTAIKQKVMVGSGEGKSKVFKPQAVLTRAEAAVLLLNIIGIDEKKIVMTEEDKKEEEKIVVDDGILPIVKLEAVVKEDRIVLEWSVNNEKNISGYKVVASKSDSSPIYPEDGAYRYVEVKESKRIEIKAGSKYNDGDVGKFESGEYYYFAITALYGDKKVSSNILKLKLK